MMDWGRAKTILILSFLFLNLFLGLQVWQEKEKQRMQVISPMEISELKRSLKQDGIRLPEEIPAATPKMGYVNISSEPFQKQPIIHGNVQSVRWDGDMVLVGFKEPVPLSYSFTMSKIEETVKPYVNFFSDYRYDEFLSTQNQMVFTQIIQQYPVFSSLLSLDLTAEGWIGYKQRFYVAKQPGNFRQVVSAYTALAVLYGNGIFHPGEEVKEIRLGYAIQVYDPEVKLLVPVWRVVHTSGIHYVNAITGAILDAESHRSS